MKKRDKKKRARKKVAAAEAKLINKMTGLSMVCDPPEEWLAEERAKKSA